MPEPIHLYAPPYESLDPEGPGFHALVFILLRDGLDRLKALGPVIAEKDKGCSTDIDLIRASYAKLSLFEVLRALTTVPELRGSLGYLEWLSEELSNAVYGASGPLGIAGAKKRGHPKQRTKQARLAMNAAASVELMQPFIGGNPDRNLNKTIEAVGKIFRAAGVKGQGGRLVSNATINDWHTKAGDDVGKRIIASILRGRSATSREEAEAIIRNLALTALRAPDLG